MARKRKPKLHLTERALSDIADIEAWSVQRLGRKVANKYLKKIETAVTRIRDNPELLRPEADFHDSLRFYRVEKHLLVCECSDAFNLVVLSVINATMDIPARLLDLEPSLAAELKILREQLRNR